MKDINQVIVTQAFSLRVKMNFFSARKRWLIWLNTPKDKSRLNDKEHRKLKYKIKGKGAHVLILKCF